MYAAEAHLVQVFNGDYWRAKWDLLFSLVAGCYNRLHFHVVLKLAFPLKTVHIWDAIGDEFCIRYSYIKNVRSEICFHSPIARLNAYKLIPELTLELTYRRASSTCTCTFAQQHKKKPDAQFSGEKNRVWTALPVIRRVMSTQKSLSNIVELSTIRTPESDTDWGLIPRWRNANFVLNGWRSFNR